MKHFGVKYTGGLFMQDRVVECEYWDESKSYTQFYDKNGEEVLSIRTEMILSIEPVTKLESPQDAEQENLTIDYEEMNRA